MQSSICGNPAALRESSKKNIFAFQLCCLQEALHKVEHFLSCNCHSWVGCAPKKIPGNTLQFHGSMGVEFSRKVLEQSVNAPSHNRHHHLTQSLGITGVGERSNLRRIPFANLEATTRNFHPLDQQGLVGTPF